MAEQVKIFDFSFGNTVESIAQLTEDLKELKKTFKALDPKDAKFLETANQVKILDTQLKTLNAVTKENVNALGGINTASKFASGSYGELKQKIDAQKKALLELNVNSKEFADTQEDLIKLQEQRIAIEKKIPSLFQERIKGAIDESNSLKQLRIDLKAAQSAALNGDGAAAQRVAELRDKIDDLKDSTKSLQGSGVERLNTSMALLTQGFQDFDTDKIKTGFNGISAAMSAIPIILIIEGIKALIDNFEAVVKFAKEITGSFSESELAVRSLTKAVQEESIVNNNLIASYDREIKLLEAKGGHEKEITELKRKKIIVEIAEAENSLRLNIAKVTEAHLNNTIVESIAGIVEATYRKLGLDKEADFIAQGYAIKKKQRLDEELKDTYKLIEDSKNAILDSKVALEILDIEYNKKQVEKVKENNKQLAELEKEKNKEIDEANKTRLEAEQLYSEALKKEDLDRQALKLKELENSKKLENEYLEYRKNIIDLKLLQDEYDGINRLEKKIELLNIEKELELSNSKATEEEKAIITEKYRQQEQELTIKYYTDNLQMAGSLTGSLANLSDSLFEIRRSNLVKGSEEDKAQAKKQFEVNKAFSIATALISGAVAIINASASVPYLPVGLAASIAAGITTAATVAKISTTEFKYFDGGFTAKGNPHGEAQSMGNAQFHNNEYVVPHKVLSTKDAEPHVTALEMMRKGFKPTGVSGFFDGGFTARSASANTISQANTTQQIADIMRMMPTPVVKVTDINRVNRSSEISVNVSSL